MLKSLKNCIITVIITLFAVIAIALIWKITFKIDLIPLFLALIGIK